MKTLKLTLVLFLVASLLIAAAPRPVPQAQDGTPPDSPIKLIFIHHSCGKNWLSNDNGGLGIALAENNYFVSDTHYGWGPDSIGDATDIPNWLDWFASDESPRYLDALYNESEPSTDYSRPLADPGGENEIILFKSCFPNSALKGNINDVPTPDGWLTIGKSKYVYNRILEYFATRPDKLFIAITAPPLSDSTYAENARAFNDWLVNDWLADYPLDNVAVFDFHAILTGENNHHRLVNGEVEHTVQAGMNTLAYPSGDDHPAKQGNLKATEEFLPLLNYYYNRWQAGDTSVSPVSEPAPAEEAPPAPELYPASPPSASSLIDNFEGENPADTYGWQAFTDEQEMDSKLSCAPSDEMAYQGARSLKIDYDIVLYSWGTCDLSYENAQNWSDSEGISFYVHATQGDAFLNVDLFVENPQGNENYVRHLRLDDSSTEGWQQIFIKWDEFKRVDWEENGGSAFTKPENIHAIAFGFETPDSTEEKPTGVIYIDELALGESVAESAVSPETTPETEEATPEEEPSGSPLPCVGGLVFPLGLVGLAFARKKKN